MKVNDFRLRGTSFFGSAAWDDKKALLADDKCQIADELIIWQIGYEERIRVQLVMKDGTKSGIFGMTPEQFEERSPNAFIQDMWALSDTSEQAVSERLETVDLSPDMKVETGGFEVLASGSVLTHRQQPLLFRKGVFEIEMVFEPSEDINDEEFDVQWEQKAGHRLQVTFHNFRGNFIGSPEPIRIGTLNNRALYLNYLVTTADLRGEKLLNYTWYLEKEPAGEPKSG